MIWFAIAVCVSLVTGFIAAVAFTIAEAEADAERESREELHG